eukprot:5115083-Amphidinium_carterae.1
MMFAEAKGASNRWHPVQHAALDLFKTAFWVQDPGVSLPDGVAQGDGPGSCALSEDVEQSSYTQLIARLVIMPS